MGMFLAVGGAIYCTDKLFKLVGIIERGRKS